MPSPNFLLISIDSLRQDYCSFLNESESTMDFLEDLADKSTVFERAISPSVWTLPVHTSIFTGLYPSEHQVNDANAVLGDHPTFAEILRNQGYETRSFTHNGWFQSGEMTRGFDHDHTRMPGMMGYGVSNFRSGLDEGDRSKILKGAKQILEAPLVKGRKAFFRHRFKGARTVNNCFKRLESRSDPFCYIVHLNDVHHVYRPNVKYYRQFGNAGLRELHQNVIYQETLKNNRHAIRTNNYPLDQNRLKLTKDLYRASILQADALVRRLVDRLERLGVYEDTVIIIFGDHGDLIGEDGGFGHAFSLVDELIRVPLLIHDPTGYLEVGRRTDVVQLNDLYPTIIEMVGGTPPDTNSVSLRDSPRDAAYVHLLESTENLQYPEEMYPPLEQYAVWESPSSKLVYYPKEDTTEVRGEDEDGLRAKLDAHFEQLNPVPTRGERELKDATRSQLEHMGYL